MTVDVELKPNPPKRELSGRLAGLTLTRQIWTLAAWPLAEMYLAFLVGTVDLVLAGRLDPQATAVAATDALGVSGFVGWLMTMVFNAVGIGASALIARAVGARHRSLANAVLGQAVFVVIWAGLIMSIFIWSVAPWVGVLAHRHGDALIYCTQYLRIITLGGPACAVLLIANAAMRGAGDTRTPFLVMAVINVINTATSILFVYGPGPIGGHGVEGIAAGTALAWWVGMALALTALARNWGTSRLRLRMARIYPHPHTIRRIVKVGLPNLFESAAGMWVGNFVVVIIVGMLGIEGLIGSHMIVIRFESMSFLSGAAISVAAATLAGQYLGLGDPIRARQAVLQCWKYSMLIMCCFGVLYLTIPRQLVSIITDAPQLIDAAVTPLRICAFVQFAFATHLVLGGALRGAGDTRTTMKITTGMTLLVRVPLVYFVGITLQGGFIGIWIALCIELTARAILFAWRFLHGGWMKVQV